MKKSFQILAACLFISLTGCQTNINRTPGSIVKSKEELKDLKQRRVELSALSIHFLRKKNQVQLEKIQSEQKSIEKKIKEIEVL